MRLAAGAGTRPLREHGSRVDLFWTDAAAGLTTRPGEGESKQTNLISPRTWLFSCLLYLVEFGRMSQVINRFFLLLKELGVKHPLHRKKLQLALQALGSEEEDNKGKLDYNWVTSEY